MPESDTPEHDPSTLRSARWFAPDDQRRFGHRSRLKQMGFNTEDFKAKPVIGILNTWSDMNNCHTHFRDRAEEVKRGVWQAGGCHHGRKPRGLPVLRWIRRRANFATVLAFACSLAPRRKPWQPCVRAS